ncbi:MAG: CHRD domain-containing protein [Novosphingobium sp.]|nr:CHRD domain-containing protein [Novosphingobium sp.]
MNALSKAGLIGALASGAMLAGCATVEEAVVQKTAETYHATLTGAQETHGGDPDGYATAQLSVADRIDQVCYDINDIRNIGPITAIHIHRGAPGVDGPPVWTLKQANEGGWKDCTDKAEWMQDAFENHFRGFYVNIHTTEYPNGAIRGQFGD